MTRSCTNSGGPCRAFPDESASCIRIAGADLCTLGRLVDALEGHEDEIASRWERDYALTFGDRAFHSLNDFRAEANEEIREIFGRVREQDVSGLSEWLHARGRLLFERGVPFPEVCRSLHLFEESVVGALRSLGRGAEDVLELYSALDHLSHERLVLLAEAYHETCHRRLKDTEQALITEVARREEQAGLRERMCGLVGRSAPMQAIYERLSLAAGSRDTVLLTGDTGTGKDLAARTIHALAGDPPERFVPVNCAALSHNLIESELFGHTRGSFSGAQTDHPGLFRAAQGGTLFLDEVTELPPEAQAKLLRALQERAVRPVGGLAEIAVTARIVASTNRDLEAALDEGMVRRDLYYRLRQMVIAFPSLADRRSDIPLLVRHFAEKAATDGLCSSAPQFTADALERLGSCEWPGNVRELENVVRLACRVATSGRVDVPELGLDAARAKKETPAVVAESPAPVSMREAEQDAIQRALQNTEGNKTQAARLLGISRKQLYAKLRAFGL